MERAGRAIADVIASQAQNRTVLLLCGKGNNGGDGYVIARRLREQGQTVHVATFAPPPDLKGDAALAYAAWRQAGGQECNVVNDLKPLEGLLARRPLIVDAVLGTGARGPLPPAWLSAFALVNQAAERDPLPVLAVDMPSGVSADSGEVLGGAIRASQTLTIGFEKLGLRIWPGCGLAGQIQVVDIGYPRAAFEHAAATAVLLGLEQRQAFAGAADAHKGSFGALAIVGGCFEMPGAPALTARAALRAGCGRVYVFSEAGGHACLQAEVMRSGGRQAWSQVAVIDLLASVRAADAIVVGPGMGRAPDRKNLLKALLEQNSAPLLVDADALYMLADCDLQLATGRLVITPHPGEAAAMLGWSVADVQAQRLAAAQALQQKFNATVVLKGAGALVWDGRQLAVSPVANPALAAPGSGDVLAGVIGALLAKGQTAFGAATAGVWAHGQAASVLRSRGNLASEIADAIAAVAFAAP
jgi:NAD(P)H-hydrate epimerase